LANGGVELSSPAARGASIGGASIRGDFCLANFLGGDEDEDEEADLISTSSERE